MENSVGFALHHKLMIDDNLTASAALPDVLLGDEILLPLLFVAIEGAVVPARLTSQDVGG